MCKPALTWPAAPLSGIAPHDLSQMVCPFAEERSESLGYLSRPLGSSLSTGVDEELSRRVLRRYFSAFERRP